MDGEAYGEGYEGDCSFALGGGLFILAAGNALTFVRFCVAALALHKNAVT